MKLILKNDAGETIQLRIRTISSVALHYDQDIYDERDLIVEFKSKRNLEVAQALTGWNQAHHNKALLIPYVEKHGYAVTAVRNQCALYCNYWEVRTF